MFLFVQIKVKSIPFSNADRMYEKKKKGVFNYQNEEL